MNVLALVLHLGSILKTLKDVEQGIADVVSGKPNKDDLKVVLGDLKGLIESGVINLPGISKDQASAVIVDVQNSLAL